MPPPGETVRYEIEIHKFIRQGETYLFLFSFNGFIGDTPLITMTDGCAGFFTGEEVKNSGGIILTADAHRRLPPAESLPTGNRRLHVNKESYDDAAVQALRKGRCGRHVSEMAFAGITLPDSLRLPGGRMKLIDRILNLAPDRGAVRAGADPG